MPLLNVTQARAQVQTDLTEAAFKKIYDAENKRIEQKVGKNTAVVETLMPLGLGDTFTRRPILSVTSIEERYTKGSAAITLAADDYRVLGARMLRRVNTGTNARDYWGAEVRVTYDPTENIDRRNLCLVELIRIALDSKLAESEKDGDYSAKYKNTARARKETLEEMSDVLGIA